MMFVNQRFAFGRREEFSFAFLCLILGIKRPLKTKDNPELATAPGRVFLCLRLNEESSEESLSIFSFSLLLAPPPSSRLLSHMFILLAYGAG